MTDYTCPKHGAYSDAGFPPAVTDIWCVQCSRARDEAANHEAAPFQADYRAWHSWHRQSGVPARGLNRTLANWAPIGRAQDAASRAIRQWAANLTDYVQKGSGLTLLGPPGVGKTHLAYGLVAAAYGVHLHAKYIVWGDAAERHKATFGNRGSDDHDLIETLKHTRLLVLDEVGVRVGSEFDQALLFDLIDTRYRNMRSTLVASNLTAETLDSIGERTADRLRETNLTVVIPGDSQRQAAATNRALIDAPPALIEPERPVIPFQVCINGELIDRPLRIEKPEMWR